MKKAMSVLLSLALFLSVAVPTASAAAPSVIGLKEKYTLVGGERELKAHSGMEYVEEAYYAAPIVADLDGDGKLEVITAAYTLTVSDAATGKVLAVFDGEKEIKQFLGQLDEDSWKIKDLAETPPEEERECAIVMMQTETVKAGMDPADAKLTKLCTMYTYCGSNCLTMEFPFASFTFTLGDAAADYLHSFAA